jgi:hypothetical protein
MDSIGMKAIGSQNGYAAQRFVSQCIEARRPALRVGIDSWKRTLPAAAEMRLRLKYEFPTLQVIHAYEVRPRKEQRGVGTPSMNQAPEITST